MKALISSLFVLFCIQSFTQIDERPAYEAMLDGMLEHNVPELRVEQVSGMDGFIYLDARSKEEFEVSHIPGAIWVGYEEFDLGSVKKLERGKVLLVYCSIGVRSEQIARRIYESGNENVANLYGGIFQWVDQDEIVVDDNGPTDRVHAFDQMWGVWLRKGIKVY